MKEPRSEKRYGEAWAKSEINTSQKAAEHTGRTHQNTKKLQGHLILDSWQSSMPHVLHHMQSDERWIESSYQHKAEQVL
jgi:hypothetical protein